MSPPRDLAPNRPYREGVGAVIFNDQGLVWVGQRIDLPGAWQLPQGGIDAGEEPRAAVLREVAEEIGTDRVTILGETPGWLTYDLPAAIADRAWGGRFRGQRQKWFALRFTGTDEDIDLAAHGEPEFDRWRWVPLDTLPQTIVDFKRPLYLSLVAAFRAYGSSTA